jgi:hypothetical protein
MHQTRMTAPTYLARVTTALRRVVFLVLLTTIVALVWVRPHLLRRTSTGTIGDCTISAGAGCRHRRDVVLPASEVADVAGAELGRPAARRVQHGIVEPDREAHRVTLLDRLVQRRIGACAAWSAQSDSLT